MDKLVIGPDVTSLSPEEFKKKDKAAQIRANESWERAKAKGMSKKEFLEARHRAELKASRSMANVERDFNIEPKFKIVRDNEGGRGGRGGHSRGGRGGRGGKGGRDSRDARDSRDSREGGSKKRKVDSED